MPNDAPLSPVLRGLIENEMVAADCFATLVEFALHQGSGDIYLTSDRLEYTIEMRRDGFVTPMGKVSKEWAGHLISYSKVEARLASAEHRRPQDGHIVLPTDEGNVDLRISILPTSYGEDLAIRLLYRKESLLKLDHLGMWPEQCSWVRDMMRYPHGLILVTGPTGAGKTTTLYAMLRELNDGTRKINTIEDPIEVDLAGIHQSQVNPAIGLDFGDLLPAVLRQDPNVIMVGEVRDPKTAGITVRAAATGQLVLATLHATSTASAIHSILGLGVHPHLLAHSLRGVIAQALIRRVCPNCARPLSSTEVLTTFDGVKQYLEGDAKPVLYQGRGCAECLQTGYRDRTGIFEMMHVTPEIAALIESQEPVSSIRDEAVAEGMIEMSDVGKVLVAQRTTTLEEVLRVIDLPLSAAPPSSPVDASTEPAMTLGSSCL